MYVANLSTKQLDVALSYLEAIDKYLKEVPSLTHERVTDEQLDKLDLSSVKSTIDTYTETADRFTMIMPKSMDDLATIASNVILTDWYVLQRIKAKQDWTGTGSAVDIKYAQLLPKLINYVDISGYYLKRIRRAIYVCSSYGFRSAGILLEEVVSECQTYGGDDMDPKMDPENVVSLKTVEKQLKLKLRDEIIKALPGFSISNDYRAS